MTGDERRRKTVDILSQSSKPVSASALASGFNVSRQIIVGDIALIRAQGIPVHATPRGYVLDEPPPSSKMMTIACNHTNELTETELNICVDNGCRVLDVIVDHPIYGQLTGQLQISSRYDVKQFMNKLKGDEIHSLSELTGNIHLHTLECPDLKTYERVCSELAEFGILIEKDN